MLCREVLDKRLTPGINKVLDFEGTDTEFVEMVKNEFIGIIGECICEIEDGFIEGLNDVLPFIREVLR